VRDNKRARNSRKEAGRDLQRRKSKREDRFRGRDIFNSHDTVPLNLLIKSTCRVAMIVL
jgi:hypothetical protein